MIRRPKLIYSTRKHIPKPPEQIKLTVAPGEKEIYESAGAKIIVLEAQGMSTVTMAIIDEGTTKEVIFKLVKMFAPIKNHA